MWNKDELATFPGFPNISLGWTDEANNITHSDYLDECLARVETTLDHTEDGEDAKLPDLPTFKEWKQAKREETDDDLGFSRIPCDLCREPYAGDRYKATALPENPAENKDYISLEVCASCCLYIANGEEPER